MLGPKHKTILRVCDYCRKPKFKQWVVGTNHSVWLPSWDEGQWPWTGLQFTTVATLGRLSRLANHEGYSITKLEEVCKMLGNRQRCRVIEDSENICIFTSPSSRREKMSKGKFVSISWKGEGIFNTSAVVFETRKVFNTKIASSDM